MLNKDNKLFDFIKNIADQKGVTNIKTFSKGEEPHRRIVISLK